MKASIITIGNSKGVRIPKVLLEESGIENDVEIKATKGAIKITPVKRSPNRAGEMALMSEAVLRRDWDKPEEDVAWANL
jgi:antitoxin MazE